MADERRAKLTLGVETKGSDQAAKDIAGIGKTAKQLDRDLKTIGKDNALANSFKEADAALDKLTDDIRKDLNGALDDAAKSAADIRPGSSGGGSAPAAAKFRGAASLIGGSGAGDIVGVVDDIQDAIEGFGQLKAALTGVQAAQAATTVATTAAGTAAAGAAPGFLASAVGIGAMLLPLAPFVLAAVAVGLAVKSTVDSIQKDLDRLSTQLDAERSAVEAAYSGTTVSEATAKIGEYNNSIAAQTDLLGRNEGKVAAAFDELVKSKEGVLGFFADLSARLQVFFGKSKVNEYQEEVDKSKEGLQDATIRQKEWQEELDAGTFKADALVQKEAELTAARDDAASATDDAAKAEKDRAREAEKAQQDMTRAAEKAQQEQEKAAQEAQQQAEKAAAAQQKYADGIKSANDNLKQATADIGTKLSQGLVDNLEGMFRDVTDIATQFRRDTFDADIKANQAERDALTDHLRSIDDIREEAQKSEQEANQEGDFKALFLARQAGAESLRTEQKETARESQDRKRADQDSRADMLRSAQRERADRMLALERQNVDSRTAAGRELQQAQLARSRALEANSSAYAVELKQLGAYLQQRNQMQASANQQALQQMGSGATGGQSASAGSRFNANQTIPLNMIPQTYLGKVIAK